MHPYSHPARFSIDTRQIEAFLDVSLPGLGGRMHLDHGCGTALVGAGLRGRQPSAHALRASLPFTQTSRVEIANTAAKSKAFAAKTVQKTSTNPIVENHAQSTTSLAASSRARTDATAAANVRPIRLKCMGSFPSRMRAK